VLPGHGLGRHVVVACHHRIIPLRVRGRARECHNGKRDNQNSSHTHDLPFSFLM
jgi:hypothetical protein